MPLPDPIIDDRSYVQLRDELIRRIPVYCPEWTDHNPSDPGVTLIELFAFLGENLLFRFNQIPEKSKLAYLRLLKIPPQAAVPAQAMLAFEPDGETGVLVPRGTEVRAGALPFETRTEVNAWPVSMLAVARIKAAAPDEETEPEVFDFAVRSLDALERLGLGERPDFYQSQTVPPDGAGPPVNFDETVDRMIWFAVLNETEASLDLSGEILNIGFVPDPALLPGQIPDPCPGAEFADPGPAVEWQVSTGRLSDTGEPIYRPLRAVGDTTRGLSREGVVRLQLAGDATDLGNFLLDDLDLAGAGQFPPALDDENAAKALFWVRAFRHDGGSFGRVLWAGANAAESVQSRRARPEFLGTGNGQPDQTYRLSHSPVLANTAVVQVEEGPGWRSWEEVDGFHASSPYDRHYVLDRDSGDVTFGNGSRGLTPQIGQRIRAREYRYGGGAQGNVPAGAVSRTGGSVSGVSVSNPLRAQGGADEESIEDALERIPGELRRRDRAVTSTDFRELALATPGSGVGRAETLALYHPPTRKQDAAGVVSVVVWPREDPAHPNAPAPTRNLLRRVCSWLDQRRLITTELYVIPPRYRRVAVSVGLQVKPAFGIEEVRRWVELVLRQYLSPLPPFGPSGEGWPLGRRVHGPELEAAALQVDGVEFLEGLNLAGWDEERGAWISGSVTLDPDEVPELTEITVVQGTPLAEPGSIVGPPASETTPIAVPIEREKC